MYVCKFLNLFASARAAILVWIYARPICLELCAGSTIFVSTFLLILLLLLAYFLPVLLLLLLLMVAVNVS